MRQMTFVSPFQSPFVKPFPSEAVVAAAFDPLTLSPSLWFAGRDATTLYTDAGITLVSADGNAVYQANDKSGNGRNATQVTLAQRLTYKTAIKNGLSILRGDGGDSMQHSSVSLTDFTVFAVVKRNTALADGWCGDGTYGIRFSVPGAIRFNTSAGDTIVTTNSYNDTNWHIAALMRSGSALTGYNNGTDVTTGTPTNSGSFAIDRIFTYSSFIFNGDLGEIIVFPSALSAGNMTNMWTYLNNLWAVY